MSDEEIPEVTYTENIASESDENEVVEKPAEPADAEEEPPREIPKVKTVKRPTEPIGSDQEQSPRIPKVDNITTVVANHYNELQEKGLAERSKSRIFYMRNFNNWIKSALINEFLTKVKQESKQHGGPLRVLDMCCGKGGDLLKWEKGNITHLICTDIAEVSVDQCKTRYESMAERHRNKLFTAEFFACDSTMQRLRERYRDPSKHLNLVSCQFAFHYCFESLKQAECMIRNASECLVEGGYFIGTIPDANDIMKRQQKAKSMEFGNEIYRIKFLCDLDKLPLFGAKYNFELDGVVNCPEFLVHFPMLEKLALKFGLKLVMKERFEDYFEKNKESSRHLLERMKALETYPQFNRNNEHDSDQSSSEYAHVASYGKGRTCGTLSKSEWEASSLYLVFAFQKMKKEIDEQGREVFF